MMYKSFKHQKTSLSTCTLLLKNTGHTLGFHHFKTFQNRRHGLRNVSRFFRDSSRNPSQDNGCSRVYEGLMNYAACTSGNLLHKFDAIVEIILFKWIPVKRLGLRRAGLPSLSKKATIMSTYFICVRFL
ncbi:hypothetical protein Hanom_Chr11g00969121 [Helianthus anomalus]